MLAQKPPVRRRRAYGMLFVVLIALALASCEASDHAGQIGSFSDSMFSTIPVAEKLKPPAPVEYAYFGSSVAVSADTLVVGAWGEADQGRNTGAVYVYRRDTNGLTQQTRLVASDGMEGARFGHAVAIFEDTIMVGAIYHHGNGFRAGAVYVFERKAQTWLETRRLTPGGPAPDAYFGNAVALHGTTAVIGAQGPGARFAYVFEHTENGWAEQAVLRASDSTSAAKFGSSVAIHGDTAVVGAWVEPQTDTMDASSESASSAYIFTRSGTVWHESAILTPPDTFQSSMFGYAVAIATDAVVIGAPGEQGAVFVYERSDSGWIRAAMLSSPSSDRDFFGVSVAIEQDRVVVGAPGAQQRAGTAYVFARTEGIWQGQMKLVAAEPHGSEQVGGAVAVDAGTIVLGATGESRGGIASGAAYAFAETAR